MWSLQIAVGTYLQIDSYCSFLMQHKHKIQSNRNEEFFRLSANENARLRSVRFPTPFFRLYFSSLLRTLLSKVAVFIHLLSSVLVSWSLLSDNLRYVRRPNPTICLCFLPPRAPHECSRHQSIETEDRRPNVPKRNVE